MNFRKTFPFDRGYVYLGRYVYEKLQGRGGGTFIWVGSFIWQWIVDKVWGHFWIALETSYLKMPSKFPWLKIKGMKIDNKKTQQIRIIMRQSLSQTLWQIWIWTNSDMGTPAVKLCENLSGILCTKEMYQTSCFSPVSHFSDFEKKH